VQRGQKRRQAHVSINEDTRQPRTCFAESYAHSRKGCGTHDLAWTFPKIAAEKIRAAAREVRMKRAKQARSTVTTLSRDRTGRDGAIDYALKMRDVAEEVALADHVYRVIEIVGSSADGIEAAIDAALDRAHRTLRNLRWFEVIRTSGHIEGGRAKHYQVTLKVGFTMEPPGQ
jgi:dodecin